MQEEARNSTAPTASSAVPSLSNTLLGAAASLFSSGVNSSVVVFDPADHVPYGIGGSSQCVPPAEPRIITVGERAEKAFSRTEILEKMSEIYYLAGEPILLTAEQVEEVAAKSPR